MTKIAILLLLLLVALTLVHQADRWQRRQRRWLLRRKRARIQLREHEEVLQCLEDVLPNRDIAREINREILGLLEELRGLERGDTSALNTRLTLAEEREVAWDREGAPRPVKRLRESDSQIARTQTGLTRAGALLRTRHKRGQLDREELDVYLSELAWAQLMVSVVSLVAQGHKALARSNRSSALAFYKKAQSLLIGHGHPDPRRATMIHELSQMILGQRQALSRDLMPEDDYNPA